MIVTVEGVIDASVDPKPTPDPPDGTYCICSEVLKSCPVTPVSFNAFVDVVTPTVKTRFLPRLLLPRVAVNVSPTSYPVPVLRTQTLSTVPPDTVTMPVAPDPLPVRVTKLTEPKVVLEYPIPALVTLSPVFAAPTAPNFPSTKPLEVLLSCLI